MEKNHCKSPVPAALQPGLPALRCAVSPSINPRKSSRGRVFGSLADGGWLGPGQSSLLGPQEPFPPGVSRGALWERPLRRGPASAARPGRCS